MTEKVSERVEDVVARQALEIERLKNAFDLLGVSACGWCKKFWRRSEPGTLFDGGGELVCYGCIHEWWPQRCTQLGIKDRENLEGKLVFWLRDYHQAETFKDPAKLPDSSLQELHIVANCLECRGAGKSLGQESCRFCEGRGTVWVIVSRKKA
ncbi:MAG TPA: hypothetical protein VGZ91_15550 [Candidatus Sulfotelmatobacter sp.]|jgi:hypothetical protein|nr:hypothetical protein [Candidatus Sulfotelmatobacter sp.]